VLLARTNRYRMTIACQIPWMVDYVGQRRVFLISTIVLALSVPVSIAVAAFYGNYLYALYVEVAVSAVLMVAFGPNWPYLNLNKPKWRSDAEAKFSREKAESGPAGRKRKRR